MHVATIGYVQTAPDGRTHDLQLEALRAAGATALFHDRGIAGDTRSRPQLKRALEALQPGDTLMVWQLDRLGRSIEDLIARVTELKAGGCGLRSLTETIDTNAVGGDSVFHVFNALAQFRRSLGIKRSHVGLEAAKSRGVKLGRKRLLTTRQVQQASRRIENGESPVEVAKSFAVSRATLYRAFARMRAIS